MFSLAGATRAAVGTVTQRSLTWEQFFGALERRMHQNHSSESANEASESAPLELVHRSFKESCEDPVGTEIFKSAYRIQEYVPHRGSASNDRYLGVALKVQEMECVANTTIGHNRIELMASIFDKDSIPFESPDPQLEHYGIHFEKHLTDYVSLKIAPFILLVANSLVPPGYYVQYWQVPQKYMPKEGEKIDTSEPASFSRKGKEFAIVDHIFTIKKLERDYSALEICNMGPKDFMAMQLEESGSPVERIPWAGFARDQETGTVQPLIAIEDKYMIEPEEWKVVQGSEGVELQHCDDEVSRVGAQLVKYAQQFKARRTLLNDGNSWLSFEFDSKSIESLVKTETGEFTGAVNATMSQVDSKLVRKCILLHLLDALEEKFGELSENGWARGGPRRGTVSIPWEILRHKNVQNTTSLVSPNAMFNMEEDMRERRALAKTPEAQAERARKREEKARAKALQGDNAVEGGEPKKGKEQKSKGKKAPKANQDSTGAAPGSGAGTPVPDSDYSDSEPDVAAPSTGSSKP